ncbi:MAG: ABC transporter permease [Rhodospirillaceae bacterium]
MTTATESVGLALALIAHLDHDLIDIVALSLRVTLTAVLLSSLLGLPLGALLGLARFPGRQALIVVSNTLMGLPPVVVGLTVYLLVSRAGPFGWLALLYSPGAMIMAQVVLVTPIVIALSRQVIESLAEEYGEQLRSLGATTPVLVATLIREGRGGLLTAVLAGFARASAEVGAVMIVGGNIDHHTRVMTTTIALEVNKGDLPLALALGLVLLLIALMVNAAVSVAVLRGQRHDSAVARP